MKKKMENEMETGIILVIIGIRVAQNQGYPFWGGPKKKDYSTLGSIVGSPYFGNLPSWFWVSGLGLSMRG